MQTLAAKVEKVDSISADFEQRKFTPMLKKPLVSSGTVLGKGSTALWKTVKPQTTSMLVSPKDIRIYYPQQAIVEVYPVQGQLGALAASPLPRLDVLKQFFTFDLDDAASLDPTKSNADSLAIRMTPSNAELQKHVKMVRVLLDRKTGAIVRAENTDADGDRTLLVFSNVKLGAAVSDDAMKLDLAPGTKETHPLEGMGGPP
jgi:outer membrane lipoprotein-sorting protein